MEKTTQNKTKGKRGRPKKVQTDQEDQDFFWYNSDQDAREAIEYLGVQQRQTFSDDGWN